MEGELTSPPPEKESQGQEDDDEPDRALGRVLNPLRQSTLGEDDRSPKDQERRSVTGAPCKSELSGTASGALPGARDEGGHGSEVIRVGRMANSQRYRDGENDPDRSAVGEGRDSFVEAEHRITSLPPCG
jgi:hypothetical protein